MPRVLISAAETSSDAHAAQLLRALRELSSDPIEAFGIGGPALKKEGLRSVVDARELLSMGFIEILGRLPKIFRALKRVEAAARASRPAVAVFLDYPDFHFRLARRLGRIGIPLVYYIPPKVWAWRKRRVFFLKRYFKKILCILPFEEKFYADSDVPASYVGSPLQDELPLGLSREEARSRLSIGAAEKTLAVLAGSRPAELKRHLELFLDGAEETAKVLRARGQLSGSGTLLVLLPFATTADLPVLRARVEAWQSRGQRVIRIRISEGDSGSIMKAADVGLIKSGTSTLEAALLGLPHVVAYCPNALTCFIVKRLIRYQGPIGLSNLVTGSKCEPYPISELTCSDVTPQSLARELVPLFSESADRARVLGAVEAAKRAVLRDGESPSHRAAREILSVIGSEGVRG